MSSDKEVSELHYSPTLLSSDVYTAKEEELSHNRDAKLPLALRPFSVFTRHEQWAIVIIAGFAALFRSGWFIPQHTWLLRVVYHEFVAR